MDVEFVISFMRMKHISLILQINSKMLYRHIACSEEIVVVILMLLVLLSVLHLNLLPNLHTIKKSQA